MAHGDLERLATSTCYADADNGVGHAPKEVREANRLDDVACADALVVNLVDEPEGQNALFLRRSSGYIVASDTQRENIL